MRGYDHTAWIARVIDGNFDFVTEDWIARAYANSVAMSEHNPLADLIIRHRVVKLAASRPPEDPAAVEARRIKEATLLLQCRGYKITHPITDAIVLLTQHGYKVEFPISAEKPSVGS